MHGEELEVHFIDVGVVAVAGGAENDPALAGVKVELAARQGEGVAEHTKRTVKGLVVIVVAWMHGKLFLDCGGDRKSKGPLPSRARMIEKPLIH